MLLATRREKEPLAAFCKKCRELGVPVYEMDLIAAGEEFYAAMKRSTNGGGENSPMLEGEDDFYELFLPGWNKKWNSIPHQYTSPAQGTVHHRSSVLGCGKLSDQSPGQGGSVRKCVSPEA